jgi:hypothetical protein
MAKDPVTLCGWSRIYSKDQSSGDEFTLIKWLANGKLFVGSAKKNIIIENFIVQGLSKTHHGPWSGEGVEDSLFELASRFDGALPSFHPILLKEYLIWSIFYFLTIIDKYELVKYELSLLNRYLQLMQENKRNVVYTPTPLWRTFNIGDKSGYVRNDSYANLFDSNHQTLSYFPLYSNIEVKLESLMRT